MISKKHKKVYKILTFIKHLLILASTVTLFVSIWVFASLVGVSVGLTSSAVGIKNLHNTSSNWKYKSILRKRRTNMIKQYC